jgi:hypothetical protein
MRPGSELLMVGLVPQAYACSDEAWDRRQLVRQRVALVGMQTSIKCRVHALLELHPEAPPVRPEATDLFGRAELAWLRTVEVPSADRGRLDQLLTIYEFLHRQINDTNAIVRRLVQSDPACQWRVLLCDGVRRRLVVHEHVGLARAVRSRSGCAERPRLGAGRRDRQARARRLEGTRSRGLRPARGLPRAAGRPLARASEGVPLPRDSRHRRGGHVAARLPAEVVPPGHPPR